MLRPKKAGLALAALLVAWTPLHATTRERRLLPDELRVLQLNHKPALGLVDVRPPTDYDKGHIQGAKNVVSGEVQKAGLDRNGTIVIYCGEDPCPLTSGAYKRLTEDGYKDVVILAGGLPAWVAKGYPVVAGDGTAGAPRATAMRSAAAARDEIEAGTALPVDTRPAEEFKAGHLPGAVNAPLEELAADAVRLPKDKELVVYDRLQARARQAVKQLAAAGLNAKELPGGLAGWAKRGRPLEVK
ncbi:MAG: hypothetical protein HY079_05700 [Elusimicrobia bacterium]|nr:hypothetical protein [Elusimicrobiota bacterium]